MLTLPLMPLPGMSGSDEFGDIARRFAPLTFGAPEALGLRDDAALIASRPGYDLVISQDTVVEGVHFLPRERADRVAQKLLRSNLSDLAAKGAEPYGCFLAISWPAQYDAAARDLFAAALKGDLAHFGMALFGGDTTATPGPLTASLTVLGWVKAGSMVKRAGAKVGDAIVVSGTIGDAYLGLKLAQGDDLGLSKKDQAFLLDRFHCPQPRLSLRQALLSHAHAAADVSDGLLADCGHVAAVNALGSIVQLETLPLSPAAQNWLERQADRARAVASLATGGDDYEIVCAVAPDEIEAMMHAAVPSQVPLTIVGRMAKDSGQSVTWNANAVSIGSRGFQHV